MSKVNLCDCFLDFRSLPVNCIFAILDDLKVFRDNEEKMLQLHYSKNCSNYFVLLLKDQCQILSLIFSEFERIIGFFSS